MKREQTITVNDVKVYIYSDAIGRNLYYLTTASATFVRTTKQRARECLIMAKCGKHTGHATEKAIRGFII